MASSAIAGTRLGAGNSSTDVVVAFTVGEKGDFEDAWQVCGKVRASCVAINSLIQSHHTLDCMPVGKGDNSTAQVMVSCGGHKKNPDGSINSHGAFHIHDSLPDRPQQGRGSPLYGMPLPGCRSTPNHRRKSISFQGSCLESVLYTQCSSTSFQSSLVRVEKSHLLLFASALFCNPHSFPIPEPILVTMNIRNMESTLLGPVCVSSPHTSLWSQIYWTQC
ncbi:BZ3500_MvSof-1268-A1-R1_Chr10-1g02719 [Microbotryum saponariae]|uniref:BZ3500_MvSof-1268-A1-R1_Chr10-1g02719 protein n=1 Tax=Microbotryum saponariae TaxID=289078 RepID=A0A2X0L4D3_9BASI|nr:BZ3500_MvSof-1268-A1-R1_Chr10-1g02719 [Microbotryum saponariae]SDA06208.1 BZ3501_MvSof-1269-A2-R1_Chr10-1g02320 [Microbotryum saponariae]